MKRISLLWLPVVLLMVGLNLLSCGSSGGGSSSSLLDSSFGGGGKVITSIGTVDDEVFALALQSDGKLVTAGYSYNSNTNNSNTNANEFALARYNTDGSLDTDMTTGFNPMGLIPGTVTMSIGSVDDEVLALAIYNCSCPLNGKLVAAGYSNTGTLSSPVDVFALARYNTDGSLDTTFNPKGTVSGVVTTTVGTDGAINSLIIQTDGKLVAAGYSYDSGLGQNVFTLARYNTDGSLDTTTFNTTSTIPGVVTTAIGSVDDKALALAIQTDGKLVAAGYSAVSSTQFKFALVRYNPDGTLDPTFGTGGKVTTTVGSDDAANALAIQPLDGKLVAGGYSLQGEQYEFALARYNTAGSLDATGFNPTGTVPGAVTTAIGAIDDEANGLVVQPDGKLVAAGYSAVSSTQFKFALISYNTNGTLDTTFNFAGQLTTTVGHNDAAQALIIQSDDKLVAAGYSYNNGLGQYEFALVRYLPLP